jgi:predicted DNA-binding protein YlxM (UPF0122 family)
VLEHHWPDVERVRDVTEFLARANPKNAWIFDKGVRIIYPPESGGDYTKREKRTVSQLKKLTQGQVVECVAMYESGLSLAPIALYFGVSRQAMWDLLRRRTKMRSKLRFGRDNHFYRDGLRADDQAQNLVETAIQQGVIQRKTACESCGSTKYFKDGRSGIQAHHDDYNKPLDVRWLCQKCHHEWHANNLPKRKEVAGEVANLNLIAGGFP